MTGFRHLYFIAKAFGNVFSHDPVRGCEKGKHVLYEVLLVTGQFEPVFCVLKKVDFVHRPEGSHVQLIHFPDVFVLNGRQHEPVRVRLE